MKSRDQRAPVPNAERQSSMIVDAERVVRSRRDARKAEVRERGGPRRHPADQGLNTYLRQHSAVTREVPVSSPEILRDLDTPKDYERLLQAE